MGSLCDPAGGKFRWGGGEDVFLSREFGDRGNGFEKENALKTVLFG